MTTKPFTSVNLQIGILVLLVFLAPIAMTLTPYDGIFTDGVWRAQFHSDPLNPLRASLIIIGMVLACVSCVLLIRELIRAANEVLEINLGQKQPLKPSEAGFLNLMVLPLNESVGGLRIVRW